MTDTPTPRRTIVGRFAGAEHDLAAAARSLAHIPHPHLARRAAAGPVKVADQMPAGSPVARFNTTVALLITRAVGSMWCAYLFAALDLFSLPTAIRSGTAAVVTWVAQTFLQLVLLSVIMVGQNVQSAAADARAKATFDDGEAILHYADGHAKNITQLRAELEQGLAHVHTKLDDEMYGLHRRLDQVVSLAARPPAQEPPAATAVPTASTPPGPPPPPAAAPPPAAPPSSPPADGPTGTAATS